MAKIKQLRARKIYDSKGDPTLEVSVVLDDGSSGLASVPSGASVSRYEAHYVLDIEQAIRNVELIIGPSILGQEAAEQSAIDSILIGMDGSKEKQNLGANVLLGVSHATAKAAAVSLSKPLFSHIASLADLEPRTVPLPLFNLVSGGIHADNNLTFQDFMFVPIKDGSFADQLKIGVDFMKTLSESLKRMGFSTNVGLEGGFAPTLQSNEAAIEILVEAMEHANLRPAQDAVIAIDISASHIPDLKIATYPDEPLKYYKRIVDDFPILYLEDPFVEDDFQNWSSLTLNLAGRIAIVGDDLFTTNPDRLEQGIGNKLANATVVMPNQIGTLTETLNYVLKAKEAGLKIVVSHRSGETEDTFIADLAVAVSADFIKAGAPNRGERISKYNQLLRIEDLLKAG